MKKIIHVDMDNNIVSSLSKFSYLLEAFKSENEKTVEPSLVDKLLHVMDTFDIASLSGENTNEVKDLNNYLIKKIESMKIDLLDFLRENKGKDINRNKMNMIDFFINNLSQWSDKKSENVYNCIYFFKAFIDNFAQVFPNIILNKVDYKENYVPKYLGLSKNHEKEIKQVISDYYDKLRVFYDVPALSNVLQKIQRSCENLSKLSKNTPTMVTIRNNKDGKNNDIKPIFDERTSKFLHEYYLLNVLS